MNLNDTKKHCSKYLNKFGRTFTIQPSYGEKIHGNAIFQPVWSKTKSKFLGTNEPLGEVNDEFLLYTGPIEIDITELNRKDTLILGDEEYYFVKAHKQYLANREIFCYGVLRRIYRGDENAY